MDLALGRCQGMADRRHSNERHAIRYLMRRDGIKYTEALRTMLALGHEQQQRLIEAAKADRSARNFEGEDD